MPARQTRRSAAKAREAQTSSEDETTTQAILNGNGSAHKHPEDSDSEPSENIFLFWPNVIGMLRVPFPMPAGVSLFSA
jgi:CDP-diacylglycerol--inositol 3-phosphatidyltransferase